MKSKVQSIVSLILLLTLMLLAVSCKPTDGADVWESATYRTDMEFGNGAKVVTVEVAAEEKVITFTVRTDKETVGEALMEHGLLAGDVRQFGLYVKVVNGITADYDIDQSYWAFYIDGEYAMTGVDTTAITEGAVYRLARTPG